MDEKILIKKLQEASRKAWREMPNTQHRDRASWAYISDETTRDLQEGLLSHEALAKVQGLWCCFPGHSARIDFAAAARFLADRALVMSAADIINDMLRMVKERTVEVMDIRTVEGLVIDLPVDFGNGYKLIPAREFPENDWLNMLRDPSYVEAMGWGKPATAAVIQTRSYSLKITKEEQFDEPWDAHLKGMQQVLDAAALDVGGAPVFRHTMRIIKSPGWPGLLSGGFSSDQDATAGFIVTKKAEVGMVANQIFKSMQNSHDRLELAIGKLLVSRRRISSIEKSIDLGTCIEILLMHGSSDNNEISFKIGIRAAWLLGSNAAERLEIFNRARALYTDRSVAVHTGKASKNSKEAIRLNKAMAGYDDLCLSLILKIGAKGWPDWNKLVLDAMDQ